MKFVSDILTGTYCSLFAIGSLLLIYTLVDTSVGGTMLFKTREQSVLNDKVNIIVSELCDTHKTDVQKAKCVVDFYYKYFNGTMHSMTILSPTDFIENGGVCRDFAVSVCASLTTMDIDCSYVFAPNHVFPIIKFNRNETYMYCIFDENWWCRRQNE